MKNYHMSHILAVFTQECGGLEGDRIHGHFLASQLQEAMECAKTHINSDEATLVQAVPLGPYDHTKVVTVWVHDPEGCQCKVCVNGRTKPLFTHDCDTCTFMGCTMDEHGKACDLYVHEGEGDFIARFSSEGSDYISHDATMVEQFSNRPTFIAKMRWDSGQ